MDLKEDFDGAVNPESFGADEAEESLGVNAFNHVDGGEEATELVGLHVSDEVPDAVRGHLRGFFGEFEDSAFAKEALAGGVCFLDGFKGMELADGNELDFRGELATELENAVSYLRGVRV